MQYRRVADLLGRDRVVKIPGDASVREACQVMRMTGVACLVVVENERLLGVFTAEDAGLQVVALGRDPDRTPLAELLGGLPPTVAADTSLDDALTLLLDGRLQQMPVLEGTQVVGLLTLRRLIEANAGVAGSVREAPPGRRGRAAGARRGTASS
jgi:CBS domain-containing protein